MAPVLTRETVEAQRRLNRMSEAARAFSELCGAPDPDVFARAARAYVDTTNYIEREAYCQNCGTPHMELDTCPHCGMEV